MLRDSRFELGSFAVTGGATIEGVPSALWVKTGKASGVGRLTSTLDPGFAVPFTVFTPAEISAIDLVPYSPTVTTVAAGRTTGFTVLLSHPGAPACKDQLVRKVGTLTPDVCDTLGATTATRNNDGGYHLTVRGKVPGMCTVTASVEGTQVRITRDIQVVAAADAGQAVDAGQKDGG